MTSEPAWQRLTADCAAGIAGRVADLLDLAVPAAVSFPAAPAGRCHIQALFPAEQSLAPLERLLAGTGDCRLQVEPVREENWLALSEASWSPQDLGDGVWIGPAWCRPPPAARLYLRIDPGRAFGTGRHPTTRLCLRRLIAHAGDLPACVVDYGCGSGVLAIAAARLGAHRVLATDIDPLALEVTAANAAENGVRDRVTVLPPAELVRAPAGLLFANILLRPLLALAPRLAALVVPGGRIILSGILHKQLPRIRERYQDAFELAAPLQEDGWALLEGRRRTGD